MSSSSSSSSMSSTSSLSGLLLEKEDFEYIYHADGADELDLTPGLSSSSSAWDTLAKVWMTRSFCGQGEQHQQQHAAPRARAATFESLDDLEIVSHCSSSGTPPPPTSTIITATRTTSPLDEWWTAAWNHLNNNNNNNNNMNKSKEASIITNHNKSLLVEDDLLTLLLDNEEEEEVYLEEYELVPSWTERTLQSIAHATVAMCILWIAFVLLQNCCGLNVVMIVVDDNNNNIMP